MGGATRKAKNHVHPGNPHVRKFGVGSQVGKPGKPGKPSPTITTQVVAEPLLVGKIKGLSAVYPALLDVELPREAPAGCGMSLASFFCCGGGFDLGFRSAGFRLAFANDISRHAVEAFHKNLGHRPVHRDIREVGPADYPAEQPDVVTGGFPCVTFSMAGRRMGVVDDLNGKLYLELCRVIREMRPRYFVAENVRGMLSANGGNAVKLILAEFLRLGYRTSYELVNMAEHGVPQTRERVIFVGVRLDQWRGSFLFPRRTRRLARDKRADRWMPPARTLSEAIGDLPPPGERILGMMHGDAAAKRAKKGGDGIASGYSNSQPRRADEPSHSQVASQPGALIVGVANHAPNDAPVSPTHAMSKRIARGGRPAPTVVSEATNVQPLMSPREVSDIVAARNPDFANRPRRSSSPPVTMTAGGQAEAITKGGGLRRMTVRECARVQSFPDWYEYPDSQAEGYTLVGNAVPPLYAKSLARAIIEYDAREIIR